MTHYVYSQGPDIAGELWVLDATGLPLRMAVNQKPAKPNQPAAIEFRYSYNDAVKVPNDAQLTAIMRQRRFARHADDVCSCTTRRGETPCEREVSLHFFRNQVRPFAAIRRGFGYHLLPTSLYRRNWQWLKFAEQR